MDLYGPRAFELATLLLRFQRINRALFLDMLKPFKLNFNEWLLLSLICAAPEDSLDMNQLSEQLNFGKPHVTALFAGLQKAALVEQTPDINDKRRKVVRPTKYGKGQLRSAEDAIAGGLKKWLSAVTEEEIDVFLRVMRELSSKNKEVI